MTKFYIDGRIVDELAARRHWLNSQTYKNAKSATRDKIWRIALHGDKNGNHDPDGEINHLNEAGITLAA